MLPTQESRRRRLRRAAALAAAGVGAWLAATGTLHAQTMPVETQQKLLKEQAIDAVTRGDTLALYGVMDEYRRLEREGASVPAGLFFAEADAARSHGDPVRAERAFNDYFRVASPEGEAFAEASRAYGEFRQSIPETVWTVLDTMVPVPGGAPGSDAGQDQASAAPQDTGGGRIAPFSLAPRVVTRAAFAAFVKATGYAVAPGTGDEDCVTSAGAAAPGPASTDTDPVVCVDWNDAMAYVNWLSQLSGLKFRLPTASEWRYAAALRRPTMTEAVGETDSAGAATTPAAPTELMLVPGPAEWVSDCAGPSGDGGPDAAAAPAGEATCARHLVLNPTIAGAMPDAPLALPAAREDDFRAIDLGFRIAL